MFSLCIWDVYRHWSYIFKYPWGCCVLSETLCIAFGVRVGLGEYCYVCLIAGSDATAGCFPDLFSTAIATVFSPSSVYMKLTSAYYSNFEFYTVFQGPRFWTSASECPLTTHSEGEHSEALYKKIAKEPLNSATKEIYHTSKRARGRISISMRCFSRLYMNVGCKGIQPLYGGKCSEQ